MVHHHTTALQGGFQLAGGSLLACDMDGAVRKITDHVKSHFPALSPSKKRALLVLDGCKQQVFVGQVRVSLRELLQSLQKAFDAIGVSLTAAVTMRAAGPTEPGQVEIPGERTVVVKALDARRCVHEVVLVSVFATLLRAYVRVCVVLPPSYGDDDRKALAMIGRFLAWLCFDVSSGRAGRGRGLSPQTPSCFGPLQTGW